MMILLIILLGGLGYGAARIMFPAMIAVAIIYPLWLVVLAFSWFNDQTGVNAGMINTFQFLSGVEHQYEIGAGELCLDPNENFLLIILGLVIYIALFLVALAISMFGIVALIGIPAGAVISVVGAIIAGVTKDAGAFAVGVATLLCGLGSVVVCGLLMRVIVMTLSC